MRPRYAILGNREADKKPQRKRRNRPAPEPEQPANEAEARGDAGLASDTIHPELDHMPAYAILSHIACQSGQFGGAVVGAFPQTEDAVPCAYVTQLPDVNRIDLPWRRDAIMDELQDDPVRVARMRRDLDIPQFSQAGRIILKSLAVEVATVNLCVTYRASLLTALPIPIARCLTHRPLRVYTLRAGFPSRR